MRCKLGGQALGAHVISFAKALSPATVLNCLGVVGTGISELSTRALGHALHA